jgi:serine O-acetyltransferase
MSLHGSYNPCTCHPAAAVAEDVVARREELAAGLWDYAGPAMPQIVRLCGTGWDPTSKALLDLVDGDLMALVGRDPAAHGSWREALGAYQCFRAVLAYRLAHAVLAAARARDACVEHSRLVARRIAEQAKVETGVELHPAARIGARFVVDHGIGTVIGETAVIGDDCYLLQCVVLGSTRIANNPSRRRHPVLGDRVQVGAYARILGPVRIGDDVEIGSHALVREDVPDRSRVSVLHQYQVVTGRTDLEITGVEAAGPHRVRLHGKGLHNPDLSVSWPTGTHAGQPEASIVERAGDYLVIDLPRTARDRRTHVRLHTPDGAGVSLMLPSLCLSQRARTTNTDFERGQ